MAIKINKVKFLIYIILFNFYLIIINFLIEEGEEMIEFKN